MDGDRDIVGLADTAAAILRSGDEKSAARRWSNDRIGPGFRRFQHFTGEVVIRVEHPPVDRPRPARIFEDFGMRPQAHAEIMQRSAADANPADDVHPHAEIDPEVAVADRGQPASRRPDLAAPRWILFPLFQHGHFPAGLGQAAGDGRTPESRANDRDIDIHPDCRLDCGQVPSLHSHRRVSRGECVGGCWNMSVNCLSPAQLPLMTSTSFGLCPET